MHELVRAQRIREYLIQNDINEPVIVELNHIEHTMITLEEVRECFDLVTKDTKLKGSLLRFSPMKTALKCEKCGRLHSYTTYEIPSQCLNCSSSLLSLTEDDELVIGNISKL